MVYEVSDSKILSLQNYLPIAEINNLLQDFYLNESNFHDVNKSQGKVFFSEEIFTLFFARFNKLKLAEIVKAEFDYKFTWEEVLKNSPKDELIRVWAFNDGLEIEEHIDDLDKLGQIGDKKISLLLPIFKLPKIFTGGDFITRDRYIDENNEFIKDLYPPQANKIELQNNTLIVFDAAYPHQLTKIINPKNNFETSLFLVFMQIF